MWDFVFVSYYNFVRMLIRYLLDYLFLFEIDSVLQPNNEVWKIWIDCLQETATREPAWRLHYFLHLESHGGSGKDEWGSLDEFP